MLTKVEMLWSLVSIADLQVTLSNARIMRREHLPSVIYGLQWSWLGYTTCKTRPASVCQSDTLTLMSHTCKHRWVLLYICTKNQWTSVGEFGDAEEGRSQSQTRWENSCCFIITTKYFHLTKRQRLQFRVILLKLHSIIPIITFLYKTYDPPCCQHSVWDQQLSAVSVWCSLEMLKLFQSSNSKLR